MIIPGMGQGAETFTFDIQGWIKRCRAVVEIAAGPPYLDMEIPDLESNLPVSYEASSKHPGVFQSFARAIETSLAQSPNNLGVRLAALYPLRRAALCNLYHKRIHSLFPDEAMSAFRQLSEFCIPEKLTVIAEIRFELHNMYLAANWNEAEELFRRVALLGLFDPSELHALRGQFRFLSVLRPANPARDE